MENNHKSPNVTDRKQHLFPTEKPFLESLWKLNIFQKLHKERSIKIDSLWHPLKGEKREYFTPWQWEEKLEVWLKSNKKGSSADANKDFTLPCLLPVLF